MAIGKRQPERVDPEMAHRALELAKGDRQRAWTQYIILSYRTTGNLAPGCDMRDLMRFYELAEAAS